MVIENLRHAGLPRRSRGTMRTPWSFC